ncbi:MAG: patatin-like phospholipase family protein, partial [Microthrixaceae bacterium]
GTDQLGTAVSDLRSDLLAMTDTAAVFGHQPWVAAFDGTPFGDAIDGFVSTRTRPPVPGGDPDPDAGETGHSARSHHWNWRKFTSVLSELPAANRARHELAGNVGSILTLDPLEAALRGRSDIGFRPIDPALLALEGVELRMTVTALVAGETHYVCGDGTIVGPDAVTPTGHSAVDAIEGALASSTVPMIFEPRPIGPEVYVDGGCLQNVPVQAAVELGATDIHAVLAAPLDPQPSDANFSTMNFVGIYLRTSAEIGFYDTQRRNLATPLPDGATLNVVAPTVDVVSPFEVEPGLMLLDMDYGAMRAEEAGTAEAAEAMAATDRVVVARERAWYLEAACLIDGNLSQSRLDALKALKSEVAEALAARHGLGLADPAGSHDWYATTETHGAAGTAQRDTAAVARDSAVDDRAPDPSETLNSLRAALGQ